MCATLILLLATIASAQITSLYIPGGDEQALIGSIIGSDANAKTYAISCAPDTDDGCGFEGGIYLTEGSATAGYTMDDGADFTANIQCALQGTSSAICTESYGGSEANFPGVVTSTYTGTDFAYQAVTMVDNVSLTPYDTSDPNDTTETDDGVMTATVGTVDVTGRPSGRPVLTGMPSATGSTGPTASAESGRASSTGSGSSTISGGSGSGTAATGTPASSSSTAGAARAMVTKGVEMVVGAVMAVALL